LRNAQFVEKAYAIVEYHHILIAGEIKTGSVYLARSQLTNVPDVLTWIESHSEQNVALYAPDGALIRRGVRISRDKSVAWRFACGVETFKGKIPGDIVVIRDRPDGNLELSFDQTARPRETPISSLVHDQKRSATNVSDDGKAVVVKNPYFGTPQKGSKYSCDVFVIMPFAPEFTSIYTDHIKTTTEGLNLTVKRGDDIFTQNSIMQDVWSAMIACRLVIADCTDRNANVFYELGIAHTLAKPVVLITRNIKEIPFDIRHFRAVEYQEMLTVRFKNDLEKAIAELIPPKRK